MVDTLVSPLAQGKKMLLALRLEGAAFGLCAAAGYFWLGGSWSLFALAFLAPDLSMLCYLGGPRLGALGYNSVHHYALALALGGGGVIMHVPLALDCGLILMAHIGFDRACGYGLKYERGFNFTHLGPIGSAGRGTARASGNLGAAS